MGGQTALNTALALHQAGRSRHVTASSLSAPKPRPSTRPKTASSSARRCKTIGLETPRSKLAHNRDGGRRRRSSIVGLPAIIRPSFTLGGTGGGIAYNREEFFEIVERGLDASPTTQILVEESVLGWKEFEMEVVRDKADNCIIICSIENVDPMGVHTGDSHHRRAGADADRQRISDHARRLDRGAARDRRRDRRLERAVRGQSGGRTPGRHRDEPARLALFRARIEGHGIPDRQGRGQARRRLHARRDRRTTSPAAQRRPRSSRRSITS